MKLKKENSYSSLTNLITSIIFLIIGAMLFNNPEEVITTISKVFGAILSIVGLFKIVLYVKRKNKGIQESNISLATSVAILIFGLLFIFLAGAFETVLRLAIGIWILVSGIHKLIAIIVLGSQNKNFASMIILSIVLIFIGGYIILVRNLVASMIGLVIMIYSAIEIAGYIIYKASGIKPEQEEPTKSKTKELNDAKDAKFEEKE